MVRKQFLATISLVMLITWTHAQNATISGQVTDSVSSEVLVGALIYIDGKAIAVTDTAGKYNLEIEPGSRSIKVESIGYNTQTTQVELLPGESRVLNFQIKENTKDLETYVVSGSRYDKNINRETISMDVIPVRLLRNTNAVDVAEAINRVPGVTITDGQASVRGGSGYSYGIGSRVNFLLDGLPLISGDLGNVEWNLIPIENIAQIEVMKSASSVFYGSGSLNGLINVMTAWPTGKPTTQVSTYFQVTGDPPRPETRWWSSLAQPVATGLFFNHSRTIGENFDLVVGGNFHYDRSFLDGNNQIRGRINFKTRYRPKKIPGLSFGLNGQFMYERAGRFVLWQNADTNVYQKTFGTDDKYYFLILDPHLKYFDKKGNKHSVSMRYYRKFRFGFDGDIDAVANNLLVDYQYQRKFFKNMFTVTGGAYVNYGWIQNNLFPDTLQLDTTTGQPKGFFHTIAAAAFAQLEFNYKRWSVVAGVRYEFNGAPSLIEGSIPVFRGGINFQAAKRTFLRGSFGQSYRIPSLGERYVTAELISGFSVFGNPDLLPERGWNVEIGVRQEFKIAKTWSGYADFALYWMEYRNMIQYNVGLYPEGLGFKSFNIGKARILGFELLVGGKGMIGPVEMNIYAGYNYAFPANLSSYPELSNMGAYLDTMFTIFSRPMLNQLNDTMVLPFRNRHILRSDLEFNWKNLSVGTTLYFTSTFENIDKNFLFIETAIFGFITPWINKHVGVAGDFTMDLRASYLIKKYHLKVSFIIKNLTNLEYIARPGIMNSPRNFNLRLDFDF